MPPKHNVQRGSRELWEKGICEIYKHLHGSKQQHLAGPARTRYCRCFPTSRRRVCYHAKLHLQELF